MHLILEMLKKGMPVLKPLRIIKRMEGNALVAIIPAGDTFDGMYAFKEKITTSERRFLPDGDYKELISEIRWFPTRKWKYIGMC